MYLKNMPSLDLSLMFTAWISSRTRDPKINGLVVEKLRAWPIPYIKKILESVLPHERTVEIEKKLLGIEN